MICRLSDALLSGRTGALRTRSSHTTVRTVPYTAIRGKSYGACGPFVSMKKAVESEFVKMAVWEGLLYAGNP